MQRGGASVAVEKIEQASSAKIFSGTARRQGLPIGQGVHRRKSRCRDRNLNKQLFAQTAPPRYGGGGTGGGKCARATLGAYLCAVRTMLCIVRIQHCKRQKGVRQGESVPLDPVLLPFAGTKECLRGEQCLLCLCKRLHAAEGKMKFGVKGVAVRGCGTAIGRGIPPAGGHPSAFYRIQQKCRRTQTNVCNLRGMCYTENETRNLGKRSVCHVLFGAIHGAKRDRELPGDGGGGLPPRAAAV